MTSAQFGLRPSDLAWLVDVFKAHVSIQRVLIFGSRAMGNFKPGSDIDLSFEGSFAENELAHIRGILEDSGPLPHKFDLIDYRQLNNPELKAHIDQFGKVIYLRE